MPPCDVSDTGDFRYSDKCDPDYKIPARPTGVRAVRFIDGYVGVGQLFGLKFKTGQLEN